MNSGPDSAADSDTAAILQAEAQRILANVPEPGASSLRLTGSIAVQLRCPAFGHLARRDRVFGDIDFAAYKRESKQIQRLLTGLGYVEDREVAVVSEGARAIFENPASRVHIDVFYDRLEFCHVLALEGRIEIDRPTLPLAELTLGKLQIVKINEKDLIDLMVLLLEHPLGENDREAINLARIAGLCAEDWGLWRTTTMNLDKLRRLAETPGLLDASARVRLVGQIEEVGSRIEGETKPFAWRMRARVGDRVKWYREVDEVR
jgi:hypothetical protein